MRWVNLTRFAGALVATIALLSFPLGAWAQGISGTAHDFSAAGWNTTTEICVVCHTPHNADTAITVAPLWNHATTSAVYLLYSSATLDAVPAQPAGISKLCLSCHDGTVGLDAFGGSAGVPTLMASTDAGYVGIDLSNDHPISFAYTTALAGTDGGLFDPTTPGSSGLGSSIDDDMLFASNLECASCHDPHDQAGISSFLVKSNTGSALCLTCHDK